MLLTILNGASSGGGTTYDVDLTEAATAADAPSAVATFTPALTESGTATDAPSAQADFAATRAEAGTATDAPSSVAVFVASDTEAASAADSDAGVAVYPAAVTEAGTAGDTSDAQTQQTINVDVSEAANANDEISYPAAPQVQVGGGPAFWPRYGKELRRRPRPPTIDELLEDILEEVAEERPRRRKIKAAAAVAELDDAELSALEAQIADRLARDRQRRERDERLADVDAVLTIRQAVRARLADDDDALAAILAV